MLHSSSVTDQSTTRYAAHTNKVFVTEKVLPSSIQFERLGQIDIGMTTYADSGQVLVRLANKAKELGADAVVDVHIWRKPSPWAWAAPHGKGQAVRFINRAAIDFSLLDGYWL